MSEEQLIEFEEEWVAMEKGIDRLRDDRHQFKSEEYMELYTTCYKLCTHNDYSKELYKKYKKTLEDDLTMMVLPSLKGKHGEWLLKEFVKRWSDHKVLVQGLSRIFSYLDRFYLPSLKLSLKEEGMLTFRNQVFDECCSEVCKAALSLIFQERGGEKIDRALLRNVVYIYVELGMGDLEYYQERFESPMFKDTSEYYTQLASKWAQEYSCLEYLSKANECIRKERDRVCYLHTRSEAKLIQIVEDQLLFANQTKLLEKSFSGGKDGDIRMVVDDEEVVEENEVEGLDLDDLELPPDVEEFVPLAAGYPTIKFWVQRTFLAAEHAAAGNFQIAMRLLSRQLGIKNFTPLKSLFIDLHMGSHTRLHAFSSTLSIPLAIQRGLSISESPVRMLNTFQLEEMIKAGKRATSTGKFTEALQLFLSSLHTIPLIVVESIKEVDGVKKLITNAREYVLGLQMELKRRELKDNVVRKQELAAYFTHLKLELPHKRLALMNAMAVCYKADNLITASNFARRLLETNPTAENQMKRARSVLRATEKNMTDKMQLNYDSRNPFVVCGATYVPIYQGERDVLCPYCTTHFVASQEGKLCTVCDLAVVGSAASGLLCSPAQIV